MALNDDLTKWNVSLALFGALSGSAEFTNQGGTYEDILNSPLSLTLGAQVYSSGISDASCLGGNSTWFYGLVQGNTEPRDLAYRGVKLSLVSFFANLGTKPVNTTFYDSDIPTVMASVAEIFGGIPTSLFDFTDMTEDRLVYAIIKGSNIIEELKKLAEANRGVLFTQKTGILTGADWKGGGGSADIIIPPQAVIAAERPRTRLTGPSCLRVRGRFISQLDCGSQLLSGGGLGEAQPIEPPNSKLLCTYNTVPAQASSVSFSRIYPDYETMRNAQIRAYDTGDDTEQPVKVVTTPDGNMVRIRTGPVTGETQIPAGNGKISLQILGQHQDKVQYDSPPTKSYGGRGRIKRRWDFQKSAQDLIKLKFPEGDDQGANSDKNPQESEPVQIEMTVCDPDLVNEFGYIVQDVDNLYVSTYDDLFYLAIRKFQEFKLSRHVWQVKTSYLPCLELNQIVTFTTPDKDAETVTGLLAGISVDFDIKPEVSMTLSIWAFNEVGSTNYTSGNLLMYPELCGINQIDWISEFTGDGFTLAVAAMGVVNGGTGSAKLYQPIRLETGIQHTLYVEITVVTGDLDIVVRDSGGVVSSLNVTATGTYTINFTPDEENNQIEFVGGSGDFSYIFNPILYKTVTA